MSKPSELRDLSKPELHEKVLALKKILFDMRTAGATRRIEKPSKISQTRRDIERILTVLREKEATR